MKTFNSPEISKSDLRFDIIFLILIALFLYFQLFRFPFTPVLLEGDHAVHLSNAWRMYLGETAFKDFFIFTFPGTELFYLFLFKLFGVKIYLLNITMFFIYLALAAVGLYISRRILNGFAVYLPTIIFTVFCFRTLGIHGSHRLFSALFAVSAIAVLLPARNFWRLTIAGILCGIASCFTQPRGITTIAAIVIFLAIEKFYKNQTYAVLFRSIACAALPFIFIVGCISLYFIFSAGFETYYFSTFVFPVKHYPADVWNNPGAYFKDIPPLGSLPPLQFLRFHAPSLFIYFLIPAIYVLFFVIYCFKRQAIAFDLKLELLFLNLSGLVFALGVFSAPTAGRLYLVSQMGVISLIWIYQYFFDSPKLTLAILLSFVLLGSAYSLQRQIIQIAYLDTPSGTVACLSPEIYLRYNWTKTHSAPKDYLYAAYDSSFYMMFYLKNPTPIPMIRPNNYTSAEQIQAVIDGLRKNPPRYIIWNGTWARSGEDRAPESNLPPLIDFLHEHYYFVENSDSFEGVNGEAANISEIWEIKSAAP